MIRQASETLASRVAAARSTRRWAATVFEHASLEDFLGCSVLPDGLHSILGSGPPIDVLLRIRPGLPAIVSFHGNTPRSGELKLPVFTGLNVTAGLGASCVFFNDPSLYLDPSLRLAWFAGSAAQNLQEIYPAVLRKIGEIARARTMIFFGGSGGGFASLYYASFFPESFSLVWNPQTDVTKYNPPHVEEYGRAAFGFRDHEETLARLASHISCRLTDRYDRSSRNRILYLQNTSDGHVLTHLKPFAECITGTTAGIELGASMNREIGDGKWLYLDNWGEGHVPPPTEFLRALLGAIVSNSGGLEALMATGGLGELVRQAAANPLLQSKVS